MININFSNTEEVTTYLELVNETIDEYVSLIPVPIRNGDEIPENYEFSEEDLVVPEGVTLPEITTEQVEQRRLENAWTRVRYRRNELIEETDIWALPDRTMTQEQVDYRQSLRDITNQSDPYNITWPTDPS